MAKKQEETKTTPDYAELLDIPRMGLKEFGSQFEMTMLERELRGCWCVIGPAGVGKTQVINKLARKHGYRVCVIRTAQYGLMGAGIPSVRDSDEGFFKVKLPEMFPRKGEKAIVLFDEINQGLQHAIAMFFSLIEDRNMYDYQLPDDAIVVALMNPAGANYNVQQIENNAALNRRLRKVFLVPSYADWLNHAKTNDFHYADRVCKAIGEDGKPCHPAILGPIKAAPKLLYDEEALKNNKQFMCPATVETLSLSAYVLEKSGKSLYGETAINRFAASVGVHAAEQICAYIKDHNTLINAGDVLESYGTVKNKIKKLITDGRMEVLTDLCHNVLKTLFAIKPSIDKTVGNFVQFLIDLPNEQGAMMLQQQRAIAAESDAKEYLKDFMRGMQNQEGFIEWHQRVDSAYKSVEEKIRTK